MEQVFVVPRDVLFPEGAPHGFFVPDASAWDLVRQNGFFVDREPAETDPSLKQIIPYAVVVSRAR